MHTSRYILAPVAAFVACAGVGCAAYPLHSSMTDDEIRATLGAHFTPGMPEHAVRSELRTLRIPDGRVLHYPASGPTPAVLLARISPPGGFWVDDEDDFMEWVDVSFVFDTQDTLKRVGTFRDGIRYDHGDPINAPRRPLLDKVPHWPGVPPPPKDPLDGVEWIGPTNATSLRIARKPEC